MRALLVVNPAATVTTGRTLNVLTSALASDMQVDVARTKSRGHARELAEQSAEAGVDVVVVLGGDGTVNEVINGLLVNGPSPATPALAVVPGGSTNVFARALGISNHPVDATSELLDNLRSGRSRRIGLGLADDRWFTFSAGIGLDAATVTRVEARCDDGSNKSAGLYMRSGLREFVRAERHDPQLTLEIPGRDPERVALALVTNTDPWTYVHDRPLRPTPHASFATGLDVLAMRRLGVPAALRSLAQWFSSSPEPHGRQVVTAHDLDEVTVRADRPLPFHLDGEPLGDRSAVRFRAVASALRIIA